MRVHSILDKAVIENFERKNQNLEGIDTEVAISFLGLLLKGMVGELTGLEVGPKPYSEDNVRGARWHRKESNPSWSEISYADIDDQDGREVILVVSLEEFSKTRPIELLGRVGMLLEAEMDLGDNYKTYIEQVMGGSLSGNDWATTLALFLMANQGVRDPVIRSISFNTKYLSERVHVLAFYKQTEEASQ